MSDRFKDIKVVDSDGFRTSRISQDSDLYHVYFKLSAIPRSKWVEIFNHEYNILRHQRLRKASVEGRFVIVSCCLDEVGEYVKRDVERGVKSTNEEYHKYLERQQEELRKKQQLEKKEREKINAALEGLEFDKT